MREAFLSSKSKLTPEQDMINAAVGHPHHHLRNNCELTPYFMHFYENNISMDFVKATRL
jgi:hypothetical protein